MSRKSHRRPGKCEKRQRHVDAINGASDEPGTRQALPDVLFQRKISEDGIKECVQSYLMSAKVTKIRIKTVAGMR